MRVARGGRRKRCVVLLVLYFLSLLLVSFGSPPALVNADNTGRPVATSACAIASLAWNQNRIAVVKPIFSATAYTGAFYGFYAKYSNVPWGSYVTTDLNLLNRTVVHGWGWSNNLRDWFNSSAARSLHLVLDETVTVVDEIQVDQGALFQNGTRMYDVLILGFTEYVTEREYLYYKQFVESGGTLIIMDACNFLAQVTYSNGYLSLTRGHGWEFNGTHAWKSPYHRWPEENRNWIGGNYWRWWNGKHYDQLRVNTTNDLSLYLRTAFGENITSVYGGHEENILENMTGSEVIGYWHFIKADEYPGYPVAAYLHRYGRGLVIHSGIMASDVILLDRLLSVFLAASIRFGLNGEVGEWTYPEPLIPSDDLVESVVTMYDASGRTLLGALSGIGFCDIDFSATTDVLRHCCRCDLDSVSGELRMQVGAEYRRLPDRVLLGHLVSNNCWRLDVNTFPLASGNYSLVLNATWKGVRASVKFNESISVFYFSAQNGWWPSILLWAIPAGVVICTASVAVVFTRFSKFKT